MCENFHTNYTICYHCEAGNASRDRSWDFIISILQLVRGNENKYTAYFIRKVNDLKRYVQYFKLFVKNEIKIFK